MPSNDCSTCETNAVQRGKSPRVRRTGRRHQKALAPVLELASVNFSRLVLRTSAFRSGVKTQMAQIHAEVGEVDLWPASTRRNGTQKPIAVPAASINSVIGLSRCRWLKK